MKILVCISSVPDTTTKINFSADGKDFNKQGVQFIINPYDEFGLTKALKLKEKHGGTVTVINVGLAENEPVIRKALAIGADDAIRIDGNPIDGISVAKEIAEVAKAESYDLIITGRESIDYNGGIVPHALGALLNIPSISPCIDIEIENSTVTLETFIDGGKEKSSATLPVVIGSQKGLVEENELIIPNMRGIMMSRSKPLKVVPMSGQSPSQTVASHELPKAKQACKMIDASNVDELVNLLQNEAKVL
jgi:electron transfer flavoprotein beta subunit